MSRFEEAKQALAREVSERDRRNLVRLHNAMQLELAERKREVSDLEGAMSEIVQDCNFDEVSPKRVTFWLDWFGHHTRSSIRWLKLVQTQYE